MTATLLAVPNVSEGRDAELIAELGRAFDAHLLDVHADPDHHRSVFTLAGAPGEIAPAVLGGARDAVRRIDINEHRGEHPRVGAVDVAPVVYLDEADRGAACAEALVLGDLLGSELAVPVLLYGELAGGRTRAELRAGGPEGLASRMERGVLRSDFGPRTLHPTAGAVLVGARLPLVAFNLELEPSATLEDAKQIAAAVREGGPDGLESVRAIGIWLEDHRRAQVSTNVEDYRATPLSAVVSAVAAHARIAEAELVGLAPTAALRGFPEEVPLRGRATIEDALRGQD